MGVDGSDLFRDGSKSTVSKNNIWGTKRETRSREHKVAGRSEQANALVQEQNSVQSLKQLAFPKGEPIITQPHVASASKVWRRVYPKALEFHRDKQRR